jgi:hypothetical protein
MQKKEENQQMEIPDGVRKLMDENPELKRFIQTLLDYVKLLEKKIRELQKNYRMLERAVDELLGPNAMKWRDKPRYIQIRPIPKEARKAKTIEAKRANHEGVARPVPKEVDAVVQVTAEKCPVGHELRGPMWFEERHVEEIVPARVVRKKYVVGVYWDPVCKRKVRAKPKDVFPHERFGINLMLFVSFMRTLGITTEKIRKLLTELYGLKLSRSTILHMESRVAKEFGECYVRLRDEIRASEVVHFDDTGWPVNGTNNWLWAFVSKAAAWYTVKDTRRGVVAEDTLGKDYGGVVCLDFYPSYDKLPYRQQKCLIHLLRDVGKARKRGRSVSLQFRRFERKISRIVRDAVMVHEGIDDKNTRLRRKRLLEERVLSLCSRRYTDRDCIRVCKLLKRHWKNLFTFLECKGAHWNNNAAERAIRPSVVVRKNSYGSRSDSGASNHAVLMTVSETCRMRGVNFMDFGRDYLEARLGSSGLPER